MYYENDQVKEDEISRIYNIHWREDERIQCFGMKKEGKIYGVHCAGLSDF
jgi:hypothetical protein